MKRKRDVALKVLSTELTEEPMRRARLLREVNQAIGITHPHLVEIHELVEHEGQDLIAMEYVEGRKLTRILADGPLSVQEAVAIALPLAEALAHAHEYGLMHRDLQPSNVIVMEDGSPKLLDLGLAKLKEEARKAGFDDSSVITLSGAIYGTPKAMSPEQALGRPIDERSDVFSFGSLMYELVSGRSPFAADSFGEEISAVIEARFMPLDEARQGLTPGFVAVVTKAMCKDVNERYASMSELAGDLRLVRQGQAVTHAKGGAGLWERVKGLLPFGKG
jgi:serine/threonine-protein kinase